MAKRDDLELEELRADTLPVPGDASAYARLARLPALTIQLHPRLDRVGERVRLEDLRRSGGSAALSRLEPDFAPPARPGHQRPLATAFLSRRPVVLTSRPGGAIAVDAGETGSSVLVDGVPLEGTRVLDAEDVARGVTLVLAGRVVLVLDLQDVLSAGSAEPLGMVGTSPALEAVRERVRRIAGSSAPVLLRGETGTGKELVARAIHAVGPRADQPFVAVNMGAVPASLAASELFGHARGAFSGASASRRGFFERADGGILFLDEVGETPPDAQTALLRALETGEIQQVGAERTRHVDVRLVAATDADLEAAMEAGSFRAPLYYRLTAQEIAVPALRDRRCDIGVLLLSFLREELERRGRLEALTDPASDKQPWLGAHLVARLTRYRWPGNVRQLRNVACHLASLADDPAPLAADDPDLDRLLPNAGTTPADSGVSQRRALCDIPEEEVEAALDAESYRLGRAARRLGVSRPALNTLVDRHPTLRRPVNIPVQELAACLRRCDGDVEAAARELRVSERGLKLRLESEGLLGDGEQ